MTLAPDMNILLRSPLAAPPVDRTVGYSKGFDIAGTFGVKWRNNLRTEIEASYRRNDLDHFDATTLTGSQGIMSAMGNVLYDVNISSFIVSAGAGAGVGHSRWAGVTGFGVPRFDDGGADLQWQGIGEVALPFSTWPRSPTIATSPFTTTSSNSTTGTSASAAAPTTPITSWSACATSSILPAKRRGRWSAGRPVEQFHGVNHRDFGPAADLHHAADIAGANAIGRVFQDSPLCARPTGRPGPAVGGCKCPPVTAVAIGGLNYIETETSAA